MRRREAGGGGGGGGGGGRGALKASCDRTECEPAALADGLAGQMF